MKYKGQTISLSLLQNTRKEKWIALNYRFNADEIFCCKRKAEQRERYAHTQREWSLINTWAFISMMRSIEFISMLFLYFRNTNFIVMTHKVSHCKLQIIIHIHIENDWVFFSFSVVSLFFASVLRFGFVLFALRMKRVTFTTAIRNLFSLSYIYTFVLTTKSSSLYMFFVFCFVVFTILSRQSAHIKWNKAICFC